MTRVVIEKAVIVTASGTTEGEAEAALDAFIRRNGWHEDEPRVYISTGKVDLSGAG